MTIFAKAKKMGEMTNAISHPLLALASLFINEDSKRRGIRIEVYDSRTGIFPPSEARREARNMITESKWLGVDGFQIAVLRWDEEFHHVVPRQVDANTLGSSSSPRHGQ